MTTITLLPDDPPTSTDPDNFNSRADAFVGAIPTLIDEINIVAGEVNSNASSAAISASSALSSQLVAQAASSFKGLYSSLAGALAIPASTYHLGKFWILSTSVNPVTSYIPGTHSEWLELTVVLNRYTYDNRADIRSLSPAASAQVIVEGLGLFCWHSGSTEIDDDETCFATGSGRWILEAASSEFVLAYNMRAADYADNSSRRVENNILNKLKTNLLYGEGLSGITSLATATQTSFTINVSGAVVGDRVFVNAPNDLTTGNRLYYHALVTSNNTVTVYMSNPSAGTATITDGTWRATVIKVM